MKLCKDCKHSTLVGIKQYRVCKKLTPPEVTQINDAKAGWVICVNARQAGECGPEGKLFEH